MLVIDIGSGTLHEPPWMLPCSRRICRQGVTSFSLSSRPRGLQTPHGAYLEDHIYHTDLRSNVVSFSESGKSETDVARLDECDEVTGT